MTTTTTGPWRAVLVKETGRWRYRYGIRTCPVCAGQFNASHHNQRFCPPTDRDRARAKNSQPRSRCAKRADNAKQRGQDPTSRPMPAPFSRAWCDKRCVPGENVAPHASRFCCRDHKRRWHREASKAS